MAEQQNPFHAPVKSEGAVANVEQHRAVQEVQAAMIVAKKFPRDQHAAYGRIMAACERPKLAEVAAYAYPRGGSMVTGPSIRLAEVLSQNWGNMDFGIRELSQSGGESEVQAFAWDMETNVKQSKTFKVPHKMKARGSFKKLTDPRDIYEYVANMGARRLRACILGVIPGDVVEAAVAKCEETMSKGGDGKPLEDRIRDMLERFKEIEVSQELIEKRLQHKTTAIVMSQLVELGKIYNSIKDGMSKRSDWFDVPSAKQDADATDLTEAIKKAGPVQQEKTEATTFRDEWINKRTRGFSTFVYKNKERFKEASAEDQAEAKAKWVDFYPNNPWPPDVVKQDKQQDTGDNPPLMVKGDDDEDWNGLKECPKMDGARTPKTNCKTCGEREGCPAWEKQADTD